MNPEGPSVEELRKIQEAHEAKIRGEKEEQEVEETSQRQLKQQAGENREKRVDILDELKPLDAEIKKLQAEAVEERMAQAEQLKGTKQEKAAALAGLKGEMMGAQERLAATRALIAGKTAEQVAPDVIETIKRMEDGLGVMQGKLQVLEGEIAQIEKTVVSDEEVARYRDLLRQSQLLNNEIDQIESNPALIELMQQEAKEQGNAREVIERAVLAKSEAYRGGFPSKERTAFVKEVIQTFISEEFARRGFGQIRDEGERQRAMNALAYGIMEGVNKDYEAIGHERDYTKQDQYLTAMALRTLTGSHGTVDGMPGFIGRAQEGHLDIFNPRVPERDRQFQSEAIRAHLRTINLIRGYAFGMKDSHNREDIVRSFGGWKGFDVNMLPRDFRSSPDGPIVPRDADPALEKQIQEEFEAVRKKVTVMDERLVAEREQAKQEAIAEFQAQIAEIDAAIKAIEDAQKINKDRPIEYRDLEEKEKGLTSLKDEQKQIERDIQRLNKDLRSLGFFARADKRDLRERINKKSIRQGWLRTNLPGIEGDAQKIRQALELMNKYRAKSLYDLRNQRDTLQRNLERVQKGY